MATAWEVVRLADRSNGGLNVDTWHCARTGTGSDELRALPGERVLAIQLSDAPRQPEENLVHATLHNRSLPGDGELDLPGYLGALRDIGVRAPTGVEVFSDALHASGAHQAAQRRCRRHPPGPRCGTRTATMSTSDDRRNGLGVVVVGTGFGCYTHVRALRHAGFAVRALVGRDPDKTAHRARMFEVPRACATLAEALALSGVDAVTVATPPHTHAELSLEAMAAGRHVLCEKPFARNVDEGRGVLASAQRAGIVHLLGTEFRYDAGQALLARTVRDNLIGAPRMATWIMHVPVLVDPGAAGAVMVGRRVGGRRMAGGPRIAAHRPDPGDPG